jgi:hypothetical protein
MLIIIATEYKRASKVGRENQFLVPIIEDLSILRTIITPNYLISSVDLLVSSTTAPFYIFPQFRVKGRQYIKRIRF